MKNLIIFLWIFASFSVFGQDKNDYVWLMGNPINEPSTNSGGTMIDFNITPPSTSYFEIPLDFQAHTVLSSQSGDLQLYSNGCEIANRNHQIMTDGDVINQGNVQEIYCEDNGIGYPISQGIISLPMPNNDSLIYLFHLRKDDDNAFLNGEFLQTIVNLNKENGNGKVISIDNLIIDGNFNEQLMAVRHGNGRDWWIILPEKETNRFYLFLFNAEGIVLSHSQNIGAEWTAQDWGGQTIFSSDGTKYIRTNPFNDIHIYDFDRCNGLLSNPTFIEIPLDTIDIACTGAVVSPDSRFLYVPAFTKIYQYDLTVGNINNSRVTVAEYDGYMSPFSTTFFQGMLAPNGKIYITANNGVDVLHVIHQPNEKGLDCEVEQHGLQMPTRHSWQVPNFPHFRLYDMQGSPCDTLGINDPVATEEVKKEEERLLVYPNPAQTEINVNFPNTFTGKLQIFDITGKAVLKEYRLIRSNSINLDIAELPNGIYTIIATDEKNNQQYQEKLVVRQ